MPELPDKQYFKIGEVGRITGVKPHVLRYWESEFSAVRPQKTRTNQRLYRRRDVELLLLIKQLLYEEGFTIAGARRKLKELQHQGDERGAEELLALVQGLREQLVELIELTSDDERSAKA